MNILHVWKEQDDDPNNSACKRGCWNPRGAHLSRFAKMAHVESDPPEGATPHPDQPEVQPHDDVESRV